MIKTIEELRAISSQKKASVEFRHPGSKEKDSYERHGLRRYRMYVIWQCEDCGETGRGNPGKRPEG